MARTKGATGTLPVTLSQLNALLQPSAVVFVARKQVEQLGLLGQVKEQSIPVPVEDKEETIAIQEVN